MDGDPTDNNATLFAQGYNAVLDPKFYETAPTSRSVSRPARGRRRSQTTLRAAVHRPPEHELGPSTPNDDNANAVIA